MNIYYSDSPKPLTVTKSIFLAGPSPRDKKIVDWRIEAINILKNLGFDGEVFIPVPEKRFSGGEEDLNWTYLNQVKWECESREMADKIVFWIPRDIKGEMPGFTTNVEFGEDLASGKLIYGRPDNADKCKYLDQRNTELGNVNHNSLQTLLEETVKELGEGVKRYYGETFVPLDIWNTEQFQEWYKNLRLAGNILIHCKVLNQFRVNKNIFSFTLHVNILVCSEDRFKSNEIVFFRKSISSVLPYYKENNETYIVLVKEFRSPVNNTEGFVYELPSGSNFDYIGTLENAQQELQEETNIFVEDINRFSLVSQRQIAATLCSYTSSLYRLLLTTEEFNTAKKSVKLTVIEDDSEKTYVQVIPLSKINEYKLDYSTLGMIYEGLHFQS